ncbi:Os03g0844400 [Oryza sativa Japonica Group]|uniref:Os03g0844400 protein n=2 Tax=Oryza sativa subsp. japonica TaxID=39947 RepID=C7IZK9_ORYSJ|nr:BED zinc finger family protein [Oryza sativa Japonica Group]BAH92438.1 Os03g0844400 [Oryza sativa Japonica Group]|eukprot:NP_001173710.1 Os03g0844400 [Oryza sativa Japonica Group]
MDESNIPSFTLGDFDPNYVSRSFPTSEYDATGSAPTPPVMEPPAGSEASGTMSGSASTNTGSKRSRTSGVWQHFDEVAMTGPDGRHVTFARCRICKNKLSAKSSGGTGHLKRHAEACAKKQGIQLRQQQLLLNPDGTVRTWEYDPMVARENLARLIARQDLPLNFGESPAFENYIKNSHNPRFQAVSRQTTTRDLKNVYDKGYESLKELFSTCTFSVSVTSDIWSSRAKEDYLSVVVHFIDDDWQMQKRVLGLRLIDVSHTGENIAERIREVIDEFNLADKIFAVTMDNASANSRAMEILQPLFCIYAQSFLLHQRCACHIINLIVKCGFKRVNVHIDAVRQAITWLTASNPRIAQWKRYCCASGEPPQYENDDLLMPVVFNMKQKYLKYWKDIPMLYSFAFILDPRGKLRGFLNILSLIGDIINVDYSTYYADVKTKFYEVFRKYELKFQGDRL